MKKTTKELEISNKQLETRAPDYVIEQRVYCPEPKHGVLYEFDDKSWDFGRNLGRIVEQNGYLGGIGAQLEESLMPMKPNSQGGSGLGQETYGYPLGKCRVSSAEKVNKIRPRDCNAGHGLRLGGSRLSRCHPSSRIIESRNLSLLSENQTAKVKFMCSFGGEILPRISDGKLRYVGGESRIIAVNKGIGFEELRRKLIDVYGQDFVLKSQLPNEDLGALVSLSSDEDLEIILEEYSRLERGDGSRLRIFLFSVGDNDLACFGAISDKKNAQRRYVNVVNGIMDAGAMKQSSNTVSSSMQQLDNMLILDVSENQHGNSPAQESTQKSILSAKDIAVDVPFSSMQFISSNQVTMLPSSHVLCSLPTPFEPSDVSMAVFHEKPLKINGHSHTRVIQTESQKDVDYGGTISPPFQNSLESKLSDPKASPLAPRTQHVYSHPGDESDLLYSHDQHVSNVKRLPVGCHAMLIQTQDEVGVSRSAFHHRFDVRTLNVDPHTSGFQHPPSSVYQLQWQHQSNVNHNSYIDMDYTQQQQQYPASHLNGQQLLSSGVTGFGHIDHPWLQKKDMCNDPYSYGYISNQSTNQIVGGADDLCVLRTDTSIPDPAGPQRTGTMEQIDVWKPSIVQELEQTQFGKNVYQYNDQINRDLIHHQEISPANSDTSLPDQMSAPLHAVYGVVQFDRPVKLASSYTGPSTVHDELTSWKDQQQKGGVRSKCTQEKKETLSNWLGLESYVVTNGASKYVVPQPSPPPNFQEKTDRAEGLLKFRMVECDESARNMQETELKDGQSPQLLGSSHARIGQKYNAMGFPDNDITILDSELTMGFPEVGDLESGLYIYSENHTTKIYKSFEGIYAETPAILGQSHAGILTGSSVESELIIQLKGAAMPTSRLSHGTENLMVTSDLSSFTDDNDALQSKVLSHMPAKRENSNSSSNEAALPISINDLHMQNILQSNTPTSEPLQTSCVSESTVDIPKDIPSLPVNDSVSFGFQSDQKTTTTFTTTEDNLDDYFTIELEDVAGNVAKAPPRPPSPLLTFQASSANDLAHDNDHVDKENSNGRLTGGIEEEKLSIEEETKIKGLENGDPLSDAVVAEAEAILRGLQTIRNADLEELRELGSGTFGTVYHGRWRGSDIAIKRIKNCCFAGRPSEQDGLKADFWSEACMLSQLHHPNIVAFYGVVPDGPGGTLGTVTEFMVDGSLKQFLKRSERSIHHHKRIFIAMDAACGMEYLHRKSIVHFDLKCDNLLVNMKDPQRPICKVADFGLSKIKHQTLVSGGVRGSLPWMAPELLNGNSSMVSEKVDVFSFGIVLWELLTEKEPYAELHCGAIIGGLLNNALRPIVPVNCEPSWRSLMERCWSANPAARPSFSNIVDELHSMLASLYPKGRPSSFNSSLSLRLF